jgi:hypothetical protein
MTPEELFAEFRQIVADHKASQPKRPKTSMRYKFVLDYFDRLVLWIEDARVVYASHGDEALRSLIATIEPKIKKQQLDAAKLYVKMLKKGK